jgi:NAD-specific glutamate dehydrogenase
MTFKVDVAAGELVDKITILQIKLAEISDPAKLDNIRREYDLLQAVLASAPLAPGLAALQDELKSINLAIWKVEDDIRDHERRQDFGPGFIALARAVYHTNDRRAEIKRQINQLLGSALMEEKSYAPY